MSKRIFIAIFLIFSCSFVNMRASGVTLYVWSPNGLNIRSAPNTNAKILGALSFGDSITVIEKTTHTFTNLFIENHEEEKNPIYLKCNWVSIKVNERTGFIIDGYLLEIPCPNKNERINPYLDRMADKYKVLSLNASYMLRFGAVNFQSEQIVFPCDKGISWFRDTVSKTEDGIESEDDYVSEEIKYFKGFSKQEILIFLNVFYGLESKPYSGLYEGGMYVRRNWPESIFLFGGIQEIELSLFPNQVIIFYYNSSC
ncbi:MAG: SH3 domain-containing protein [Chitinophagaceae bacterium]